MALRLETVEAAKLSAVTTLRGAAADRSSAAPDEAPRARRRAPGRLLAATVGALPALAFPEAGIWWLAFVGFVPVLVLVQRASSGREAMWRTWFAGAGFFLAMHHWILPKVGPFALPVASLLAVLWLPWGYLAWHTARRPPSPGRLLWAMAVLPSAWVAGELVRSWEHLGGPWGLLGTSQWSNRSVVGLAALAGIWAVSFVVMAVNVALAQALGNGPAWPTRASALAAAALVLGVSATYGTRLRGPVQRVVLVAVVQPGVIHGPEERLRRHEVATLGLRHARPDLVVWGESSVGVDPESRPGHQERLVAVARAVGADVLVNVDARRGEGGILKSSLVVTPNGPQGRYDKVRMVPFGEYIPLRPLLGWTAKVSEAAAEDRRRGHGLRLLQSGNLRMGTLVCFESAFPDLSRRLATMGADVLVVQAATTTFQGSWAQPQHASLAAVRAVESGRPVVHAALSGVSAAFDATGRRRAWLPASQRGTLVAALPVTGGTTPYARYGDWLPYGCAALSLAALVATVARHPRRRRPGPGPCDKE